MKTEHKKFKTFDRVLVRDNKKLWQIDFYSRWNEEYNSHTTMFYPHANDITDKIILPYLDNEYLLGTTYEPDEEIELKEGEKIICSDFINRLNKGKGYLEDFHKAENNRFYVKDYASGYYYVIRFKDFDPSNMEETMKHILCVKDGKIVRCKE